MADGVGERRLGGLAAARPGSGDPAVRWEEGRRTGLAGVGQRWGREDGGESGFAFLVCLIGTVGVRVGIALRIYGFPGLLAEQAGAVGGDLVLATDRLDQHGERGILQRLPCSVPAPVV
jgi:hypothetical protein